MGDLHTRNLQSDQCEPSKFKFGRSQSISCSSDHRPHWAQLYPLRFFVGFLEGSSFVGIQYILGAHSLYPPMNPSMLTLVD